MPVDPSLGSPLDLALPAATSTGYTGAIITEIGPVALLGTRYTVPALRSDTLLGYTTAAGIVIEKTKGNLTQSRYTPAATDVAITHRGGTGPMIWVAVYNGSGFAIAQGAAVKRSLSVPTGFVLGQALVEVAINTDSANEVLGVAQYEIPDGYYAWVLAEGIGLVNGPAGVAAAVNLKPAAAGNTAAIAADTDVSFARLLAASATLSDLTLAEIHCPAR
tara:strand:- start:313 stop:969 length:657 start_codon:yes stop_codon:yes gene_type:complete